MPVIARTIAIGICDSINSKIQNAIKIAIFIFNERLRSTRGPLNSELWFHFHSQIALKM